MLLKTLLATAAVFTAAPAFAADAPADFLPSPVSGYLEAFFGLGTAQSTFENSGELIALDELGSNVDHFNSSMFGGSGRAAYAFSPGFSMQADGWYQSMLTHVSFGDGFSNYSSAADGLGVHATWRTMNSAFGGLVSIGQVGAPARYANFAAEGAWYGAMSSFVLQGGYATKFVGAPFSESALYAHAVATFFHNPNIAFSADFGVATQTAADDDGYATGKGTGVQWGARLDYKPAQWPFSFFAAYQGAAFHVEFTRDSGAYSSTTTGTNHAVYIGARYNFGGDTLQSIDRTAGFKDYNVIYGVNPMGSVSNYD